MKGEKIMKKYIFLSAVLSICVLLYSCAGVPGEGQTTVLYDAATTTPVEVITTTTAKTTAAITTGTTADFTTTTAQICYFEDPANRKAKTAYVNVILDGEKIEPWNALLYSRYDGIVADGYIMFMDPPYNEFPEYELKNDLKITIDGADKPSVTVRDAVTHQIIGTVNTENIAENIKAQFGAGRYIIVFDAKNYGTGMYAEDCVVYSYYFFATVS